MVKPSPAETYAFFGDQQTGADAPGHRVADRGQAARLFKVLADGTEGAGEGPGDRFGDFLELAGGIDEEWRHGASGVFVCGGEEGFEVFGRKDGVVVDHEEMGEVGKLFEGPLGGGGESAAKAEIFSRGGELARKGRFFGCFDRFRVRAVVANHGGDGADGLAMEGVEQAGEEIGAEAGGHKGDNAGMLGHKARMDDLR